MAAKAAVAREKAGWDFTRSFQKLKPESFFEFARAYPNQEGTATYVYRCLPVIDRRLAGIKDSNIDIVPGAAVDEEYLLRTHGSGRYHLKFTDSNRPKGAAEVAKTTVDVEDPHVPPLLNPVELVVGAPGNDRFIQGYVAKGYTIADGRLLAPAPAGDGAGTLARTVSDLAGRVAAGAGNSNGSESAIVSRALDMLAQRSKPDELAVAFQIADRLKPQADPAQVQMLKILSDLVVARSKSESTGPDPIVQLKETAGLLREFGWAAGAGGAKNWADVLTALLSSLPGLVQYGAQMLAALAAMRGSGGLPGAALVPAAQNTTGGDTDMDFAAIRQLAGDALDSFRRGISGTDFAHSVVCRAGGDALHYRICQFGQDTIMSLIGSRPEFEGRQDELKRWLGDFLAYGSDEEGEEGSEACEGPEAA